MIFLRFFQTPRAFGIRLPADERELLRLSPEIGTIGERLSFFPGLSARSKVNTTRHAAALGAAEYLPIN